MKKNARKSVIFYLLILPFLTSCIYDIVDDPFNIEEAISSYDLRVVISSEKHLAFPDLIYHDKTWYVTYRESDLHVLGTYSKIIVLKSVDFKNWTFCNSYENPLYDLRDPKFSFNEVTNELYLHFHGASNLSQTSRYSLTRENFYVSYNKQIGKFNDEEKVKKLKLPTTNSYSWLWRPIWHDGNLYAAGYLSGLKFHKYTNIDTVPYTIFNSSIGGETTLRFYKNRLYALSRYGDGAMFGESTLSNDSLLKLDKSIDNLMQWTILNFNGQLGGPNMLIKDSVVYIGGRIKQREVPRTAIYKYSLKDKSLNLMEELVSYGDNSYPGLYIKNDSLYGVYYTQSNNYNMYEILSFVLNLRKY